MYDCVIHTRRWHLGPRLLSLGSLDTKSVSKGPFSPCLDFHWCILCCFPIGILDVDTQLHYSKEVKMQRPIFYTCWDFYWFILFFVRRHRILHQQQWTTALQQRHHQAMPVISTTTRALQTPLVPAQQWFPVLQRYSPPRPVQSTTLTAPQPPPQWHLPTSNPPNLQQPESSIHTHLSTTECLQSVSSNFAHIYTQCAAYQVSPWCERNRNSPQAYHCHFLKRIIAEVLILTVFEFVMLLVVWPC